MLVAGAVEQEGMGAKAMLKGLPTVTAVIGSHIYVLIRSQGNMGLWAALTWLLCFFLCFSAILGFLKITKYMKNLALLLFACILFVWGDPGTQSVPSAVPV